MNNKPKNSNRIQDQFYDALYAIAEGKKLSQVTQIPGTAGHIIRIDEALLAASAIPDVAIPEDDWHLVVKARKTVGVSPPSKQMNEIARALVGLRIAKK